MARPDAHSPINTATLLLKPRTSVYELLRSVLQTRLFDPDLGFNRTGRPQHAIGSLAGLGLRPSAATNLKTSTFWRHNDWRFIGGDGDQGLIVHVYIVLLKAWTSPQGATRVRVRVWVRAQLHRTRAIDSALREIPYHSSSAYLPSYLSTYLSGVVQLSVCLSALAGLWGVHHFFGGDKPWRPATRCYRYFDFLEHPDVARRHREQDTPCRRLFWGRHACLHPNNSWATAPKTCWLCKRQRQKSSCARPPKCSNSLRWSVF